MKRNFFRSAIVVLTLVSASLLIAFALPAKQKLVLVYSKTAGFHHSSIPDGIKAIQSLGASNGFGVDSTTDSLTFTDKNLDKYAAVIFLNTTGNVLSDDGQLALQHFLQKGRGFVGIHAATDTEYDWPYYNRLIGAYFKSHPAQQQAIVDVKDNNFPATKHLPAKWSKWDEWYNFKDFHWDSVHVLMTLDESSIKGGENGALHPVSWYHLFDGGRVFYTALGHTEASYTDQDFLKHILGGIQWAAGESR